MKLWHCLPAIDFISFPVQLCQSFVRIDRTSAQHTARKDGDQMRTLSYHIICVDYHVLWTLVSNYNVINSYKLNVREIFTLLTHYRELLIDITFVVFKYKIDTADWQNQYTHELLNIALYVIRVSLYWLWFFIAQCEVLKRLIWSEPILFV